jgi:hypothetical protein
MRWGGSKCCLASSAFKAFRTEITNNKRSYAGPRVVLLGIQSCNRAVAFDGLFLKLPRLVPSWHYSPTSGKPRIASQELERTRDIKLIRTDRAAPFPRPGSPLTNKLLKSQPPHSKPYQNTCQQTQPCSSRPSPPSY